MNVNLVTNLCLWSFVASGSADENDFSRLRKAVFADYDVETGPFKTSTDQLSVWYSVFLYGLVELNDKDETLSYVHAAAMVQRFICASHTRICSSGMTRR